jgi:quercetin dioxygenase-like cupin family protein
MKAIKPKDPFSEPVSSDVRGEIRRFDLHGAKFSVLYTKADALRSGDYHSTAQLDLMLKGDMEVWEQRGATVVKKVYHANELIVIPPNIPHLFKSLTDSVMIELWVGEFDVKYYRPFRDLVDAQFKKK